MDYVANQAPQRQAMLQEIGVAHFEELLEGIPPSLRLPPPKEEDGLSELEGMELMETLARLNQGAQMEDYLGAGAYRHHVPALVSAICQKSEFLTAYTPYQAEASQGMLQAIFEYQSAVCALTGMAVSNASVYDGGCACAEALLMALRAHKGRKKLLVAENLNPYYGSVVRQYLRHLEVEPIVLRVRTDGTCDLDYLRAQMSDEVAGVLVQSPNFYGIIEEVEKISSLAAQHGALTILCANPLAYGLFASAGEMGVDIAVGDMQPFGIPLQFGGPYVGYMATTETLMRQLPGRIVGETVDRQGRRGFVLTLQAREQHIRREKATSNICSNQALAALASLVALCAYGKQGVRDLALTNYQRACYLRRQLQTIQGVQVRGDLPIFNEFTVRWPLPHHQVLRRFEEKGILAGVPLRTHETLVAVTETKSKEQLDRYVSLARQICHEEDDFREKSKGSSSLQPPSIPSGT